MCNDPRVDLVNINACLKFGEILSIFSQDIEQNQNFGLIQRPQLWYKFGKNHM